MCEWIFYVNSDSDLKADHADEDQVRHVLGGQARDDVLRSDVHRRLSLFEGGWGLHFRTIHKGGHTSIIIIQLNLKNDQRKLKLNTKCM